MKLDRLLAILTTVSLLAACDAADDIIPGGDDGPDADAAPEPEVPPEIDGRLVINELMADNALTEPGSGDWIEIYNPTEVEVSLRGYGVTDDLAEPHKAVLPDGVAVPAGGYLILWLDGLPGLGPEHLDFRLAREAGALGLSRPDRSPIDRLVYAEQAVDLSAARTPDGSDLWTIEWHASPGERNPDGAGSPVGIEDPEAAPEEVPAAGDVSQLILGEDALPEIELLIPPESVAALEIEPRVYVPATLVYQGRQYGPVGLHLKGGNSFRPLSEKAAFRVNVDEYVDGAKFFGLDDLTFNNMVTDYSMMHERAAYWVARQLGLPASRANHALITVNGEFYGLYSNVETVKSRMMGRWFADPSGPLFEATDVDFTAEYVDQFELEGGPDDRSLLQQAAEALASGTPGVAISSVAAYIDMAQFQRFWAMCAVTGQFDSFPYSNPGDDFFVYADPESQRIHMIPWGMDETFYAGDFDVKQVHSILATTCMDVAGCYQAFVDQVWAVMDEVDQMDLLGRMEQIRTQIAPYVSMDIRKPYTNARVETYQNNMRYFVTERRTRLQQMLSPAE
jgi:spore coat protein CotH